MIDLPQQPDQVGLPTTTIEYFHNHKPHLHQPKNQTTADRNLNVVSVYNITISKTTGPTYTEFATLVTKHSLVGGSNKPD
jgi:hypothetical protein